jgi:NAD(P)-dependent dehydrogenase (short-subunit alcohol dehydrogenase family)
MNTPVVLITGALTGIGRATALAFAHEGARIVVSGRREEAGQALASELRALGVEAEFVKADVRKEEEVRALSAREICEITGDGNLRTRDCEFFNTIGRNVSLVMVSGRPSSAIPTAINARAEWPVLGYSRHMSTRTDGEEISKADRQKLETPATMKR